MAVAVKSPATIGPESWKNRSLRGMKLAQSVIANSDRNCDIGRSTDTLPHIRDVLATLSNDEIRKYMREVRVIVAKLRESLLETNEEIKALTRGKEALERTIEHTRKDLQLNRDSKFIRVTRPPVEKERDGADDLLEAEHTHLMNCKRTLELQLKSVQQHLQCLESIRKRTFASLQERSRVLDILCHSLAAVLRPERDILILKPNRSQVEGRNSMVDPSKMESDKIDALGPYTPEVDHLLGDATDARNQSAYLRRELRCTIDRVDKLKQAAHKSVNEGLTQKVAETITLKQHLNLGVGENRHALHRAQRWYDATEKAFGYTQGPVQYSDLKTSEHLDRPLVRLYQRHPGTQLPEAQENIKSGVGLIQSLTATSRNIGMLRIAERKLKDDKRSKSAAADIDSSVIRMRRSKNDRRWCLGTAF
ncbi:unnamed protein product [Lymnaea stagnalis]|uniref:Coiled-coil domain-containing protein 105 n=1 Tax=Lymnaea stagnalis TaxID=6523 RepID=A0AAV2IR03_LYMST